MKKILASVLALMMVFSLTLAVSAGTIDNSTSNESKKVTIKINDTNTPAVVYSVDIVWGNTDFTYDFGTGSTWDPDTHTYTGGSQAGWDQESTTISVTNHSNSAVTLSVGFNGGVDKTATTNGVTSTVSSVSLVLASAEGTALSSAPSTSLTVSVSGTPTVSDEFILGTIVIAISAGSNP